MFGYLAFNQKSSESINLTTIFRFFYWALNNKGLEARIQLKGFRTFDSDTYSALKEHLLDAVNSDDTALLHFTNESSVTRTNAIFAICVVFMSIFIILVVVAWLMTEEDYRRKATAVINRIIMIFGLAISFAAFIIWWYAPSETSLCYARTWLLGIGYTNVIASVYIYSITMNTMHRKSKIKTNMFSTSQLLLSYFLLEALEIVILIIWTVVENPVSQEIVTDPLAWTTIYTCNDSNGTMQIIQLVYFCAISLFGCGVIYRHWKKYSPEDTRWILMALYNQLMVFVQLIVITQILNLDDNQLYVIYVPSFLFAEANVVFSFFLPGLLRKLKEVVSISIDTRDDIGMNSKTMSNSMSPPPPRDVSDSDPEISDSESEDEKPKARAEKTKQVMDLPDDVSDDERDV